ncbi:unnamed protein product [Bursaphelenchus xylophilus]|uniref:(pine wood nematode) hypothetical protein n=1 Tax=Bursaphelenchus xylophilus TaxID=6326 RepID=A0A1I7RME1_BURXY|nr:unnamed protein product [Bursaphelenchus xylophilus]CAG9118410.1 unnamed protein product [Bursaphelenchus xylophilus]
MSESDTSTSGNSADESDNAEAIKDYEFYVKNKLLESEDAEIRNEIEYKELNELPVDYLRALQSNLYLYYLPALLVVIPLLWYLTTFPYRAALQPLDPTLNDIWVPYNITLYTSQKWRNSAEKSLKNLRNEFRMAKFVVKYEDIEEFTKFSENLDQNSLNIAVFEAKTEESVRFEKENLIFMNIKNLESLEELMKKILGLERLEIITKTDENTLDVQTLSVWDRMPISNFYHVQLIYLHENAARNAETEEKIRRETEKFIQFASKYGFYADIGVEHLWDFDVEGYIQTDRKTGQKQLRNEQIEALTTEVSKGTPWMRSLGIDKPLIKIAIFSTENSVKIEENAISLNGHIVASWGGVTSFSTKKSPTEEIRRVFSAIADIIQAQIGITTLPESLEITHDDLKSYPIKVAKNPARLPVEYEWRRFEKAAFLEHCLRARAALRSIHLLRQKLEFMVITREVAVHFYEAHEILVQTLLEARVYAKLGLQKAIRARLLAEKAGAHKDLIDNLDFPFENRYAMYISLFLPIYHMVFGGIVAAISFMIFFYKVKRGKDLEGKMLPFY